MEIDADLFAAQNLVNFIVSNWELFPSELKNKMPIDTFLALSTSSIFLLFFELNNKEWPSMYFYSSFHPHPTVRISYIVDLMNKLIVEHFDRQEDDYNAMMQNTFEYAAGLLNNEVKTPFIGYQSQYKNSIEGINEYIKTLSMAREKYKQLIQNSLY